MKYCLSARQSGIILNEADEIKFNFRDRKAIPDYIEKYPKATIILSHSILDDKIDWEEFNEFNKIYKDRIIYELDNLTDGFKAFENKLPFYFNHPITSYYELEGIINLNVSYIILGAPLFFELENVKNFTNVPIRACVNKSNQDGLFRENEIIGTWIRPEDLNLYEKYIDSIEFESENKTEEKVLFEIYHNDKQWIGAINLIFKDINIKDKNYLNSLILPDLAERRIKCGQKCLGNKSSCRACYRVFELSNEQMIREYFDIISRY